MDVPTKPVPHIRGNRLGSLRLLYIWACLYLPCSIDITRGGSDCFGRPVFYLH